MSELIDLPPQIEWANKRMNKFILFTTGAMFFYGILLPKDWEMCFGFVGLPIAWAAHTLPATVKVAQVSPIPDLVEGFFGLGAWVVVLFAILLAARDPLGKRVVFAFSRPGKSFVKTFVFLYFMAIPTLLIGLWIGYFMPIPVDITGGVNFGGKLLVSMITNRFYLAVLGSLGVTALGLFLFAVIVFFIGPISIFFRWVSNDCKDDRF